MNAHTFVLLVRTGDGIKDMYIAAFYHFSEMELLNRMVIMDGSERINLEELHQSYKESSRLLRGRPEMVLLRLNNGKNVQIFRKGTVQILGPMSEDILMMMRVECLEKLQKLMPRFQLSAMKTVNLVFKATLPSTVKWNAKLSDAETFYEVEIFPATLIRKWYPAHVHVFHNQKVLITGVRTFEAANHVYESLLHFVSHE